MILCIYRSFLWKVIFNNFIDEAYALKQGPQDSFGQEAVDMLLKRMEDDRGKFVVIAVGYTKMHGIMIEGGTARI